MSEDWIASTVRSQAELINRHLAAPPHEQNLSRAGAGAALLVACGYVAYWSRVFLGADFGTVIAAAIRAPGNAPFGLYVWTACLVLGLVWLKVGLSGVLPPRNIMVTFWSAVCVALFTWAALSWYLPRAWGRDWVPYVNLVLRGIYLSLLAESVVHFLLSLRGRSGDARKVVEQQIAERNIDWRGADDRRR